MRNFGIPEPHKPRVDPSEFEDPFFGGEKKQRKPTVYMELGEEREKK